MTACLLNGARIAPAQSRCADQYVRRRHAAGMQQCDRSAHLIEPLTSDSPGNLLVALPTRINATRARARTRNKPDLLTHARQHRGFRLLFACALQSRRLQFFQPLPS